MKRRPLSDGLQPQDGDGILREGEVETALHGAQGLGVRDHRLVVLDAAAEAEGSFAEARALGTAVMQYGYRIIDDLKSGMIRYLKEKGVTDIKQIRGIALDSISDTTEVLERDTILFPKFDHDKCMGCGRCVISCADGGHDALTMDGNRKVRLNGKKCVGCHLCILVCPDRAISSTSRRISRDKPAEE